MIVFQAHGKTSKIAIHSASSPFTYGPDGTTLFGPCTPEPAAPNDPPQIAICKVDLKTGKTDTVEGTVHAIRRANGSHVDQSLLRLFAFSPIQEKVLSVALKHPDTLPWIYVSVSPGGTRAVGTHNGKAELIDLVTGTTDALGGRFHIAAWSPNGKWLAAVEPGQHGRTVLMDVQTLKPVQVLDHSDIDWSPDSRYLLNVKDCDESHGTLEAIDVQTGRRTIIESSKCLIDQATTGWVRNDIFK